MIKGSQPLDLQTGFGDMRVETDDKSEGFSTFQVLPAVERSEQTKPAAYRQSRSALAANNRTSR